MFPSARLRHAVTALTVLSDAYPDRVVSLRTIAAEERISEKYLEPLFVQLRTSELVTSVRGKHGGYTLRRAPGDLSLYAVAEAVGELPGRRRKSPAAGEHGADNAVWAELQGVIKRYLESVTLADARALRRSGRAAESYRI